MSCFCVLTCNKGRQAFHQCIPLDWPLTNRHEIPPFNSLLPCPEQKNSHFHHKEEALKMCPAGWGGGSQSRSHVSIFPCLSFGCWSPFFPLSLYTPPAACYCCSMLLCDESRPASFISNLFLSSNIKMCYLDELPIHPIPSNFSLQVQLGSLTLHRSRIIPWVIA